MGTFHGGSSDTPTVADQGHGMMYMIWYIFLWKLDPESITSLSGKTPVSNKDEVDSNQELTSADRSFISMHE